VCVCLNRLTPLELVMNHWSNLRSTVAMSAGVDHESVEIAGMISVDPNTATYACDFRYSITACCEQICVANKICAKIKVARIFFSFINLFYLSFLFYFILFYPILFVLATKPTIVFKFLFIHLNICRFAAFICTMHLFLIPFNRSKMLSTSESL
jgi:hypothetical protein